jgi:hypothetical protein
MTDQQTNQKPELVGMGIQFQLPVTAPPEKVWAAMVLKIYEPEKFLPVTNVKVTEVIPGRHVQREMVLVGRTIREEIYLDESCYKIRGFAAGEDSAGINVYDPNTGILNYYKENVKGERIPWEIPKVFATMAMEKTKELVQEETQKST